MPQGGTELSLGPGHFPVLRVRVRVLSFLPPRRLSSSSFSSPRGLSARGQFRKGWAEIAVAEVHRDIVSASLNSSGSDVRSWWQSFRDAAVPSDFTMLGEVVRGVYPSLLSFRRGHHETGGGDHRQPGGVGPLALISALEAFLDVDSTVRFRPARRDHNDYRKCDSWATLLFFLLAGSFEP